MNIARSIYRNILYKITPLDWIIISIASGIIVFFIASSLNQEKWITIEFKVTNSPAYFPNDGGGNSPYWLADTIREGDIQYDTVGNKNLEVISIKKWGFQSKELWVTASVKAKYKSKQKKYSYLYQPLEIGRSIDIAINGANIHGIVSKIQGFSDTRQLHTVHIKAQLVDTWSSYSTFTRGVEPWIANAIQNDAKIFDSSGKEIASIEEVNSKPAQRVVTTIDGKAITAEDPLKKDVFLTIKLSATKDGETFMFLEDKPIVIGGSIPLYFNDVVIYPVITEIVHENSK